MSKKPITSVFRDLVITELNIRDLTVNEFTEKVRHQGIQISHVTIYKLINQKTESISSKTMDIILEAFDLTLEEAAAMYANTEPIGEVSMK